MQFPQEDDHVKDEWRPPVALQQSRTQNQLLFQSLINWYFKLERKQKTMKCLTFDLFKLAFFVNVVRSCLEQLSSIPILRFERILHLGVSHIFCTDITFVWSDPVCIHSAIKQWGPKSSVESESWRNVVICFIGIEQRKNSGNALRRRINSFWLLRLLVICSGWILIYVTKTQARFSKVARLVGTNGWRLSPHTDGNGQMVDSWRWLHPHLVAEDRLTSAASSAHPFSKVCLRDVSLWQDSRWRIGDLERMWFHPQFRL